MQGLYRDDGIVLKGIRLGEADRILSVFTKANGRVRVVAKGVRKSKSRFGARLDAFTHVDLLLYKGRSDLDTVSQAGIIARFPRLRAEYPAFCAACAMADTVERTTPDREPAPRVFALLRSGLEALEQGCADPSVLAYAFLAKSAAMSGHHPILGACVHCGSDVRTAFSFGSGGAVCPQCIERTDPRARPDTLDAWSSLVSDGWDTIRMQRFDADVRRELVGLLVGFVQWQTDSRLRAFAVLGA